MGNLKKKIEDLMSAITFAEEGEFETARKMLPTEERRVLLAVKGDRMDRKTFRYAVNTCKRIGAKLDILYISAGRDLPAAMEQALAEVKEAGVDFRLEHRTGCLKQQIIDYTDKKKEILFAVTESAEHLEADCKGRGKGLSEAWQNLKCPLVVVSEGAGA